MFINLSIILKTEQNRNKIFCSKSLVLRRVVQTFESEKQLRISDWGEF
jgi:hypothetical protein